MELTFYTPFTCVTDYHKLTLKNMALMDHTKINFDLVLELMSWLMIEDHQELGVGHFMTD